MRLNPTDEIRTLAADEALEYAREAETVHAEIERIHDLNPHDRRALGRAHARLGLALKLADVHASLAVAEQIVGLRADLAPRENVRHVEFTKGGVTDLAESVGVIRPFAAGHKHHCADHCAPDCPNAAH